MAPKATIAECKQLKALFWTLYFKQLINEPTRITKDSDTLINLIATNNPQYISDSGVISTSLSDHEMVYCVRKLNWKKAPSQTKMFRSYANYNPAKFCEDLKGVNLGLCSSGFSPKGEEGLVDVNELWGAFVKVFLSVVDFV